MKISKSFQIWVNIIKIWRNKQTKKIVTTYPKAGVSCYTTWIKLLLQYFLDSLAQPNMVQGLNVSAGLCRCMCVPLCLFVCVLFIRLCVKRRMMKIMYTDLNR